MGASSSKSVVIDDDRQQVMSEKQLSHTFTALNLDDNEARIRFAGLSQENLARYDDEFHAEPKNLFAQNAITRNEITSVLSRINTFSTCKLTSKARPPIKNLLDGAGCLLVQTFCVVF
jgi:hypothetical protein